MGELLHFDTPHHKSSPTEPEVWTCYCGSQLFHLVHNGPVVCVTCHHEQLRLGIIDKGPQPESLERV